MSNYRPDLDNTIPLVLISPIKSNSYGVENKTYPTIEEALEEKDEHNHSKNLFYGSFKSYGGTESKVNGIYSIIDTAKIECWYRPDIKSDCRIGVLFNNAIYEIINEPEDVNMRHQFLKFKVKRIKGNV